MHRILINKLCQREHQQESGGAKTEKSRRGSFFPGLVF
jgi:hypothetical protein